MFKLTIFPTTNNETLCTKGTEAAAANLDDLAALVTKSAWSAGTFKGDYRNNANFLGCGFIALDIDGNCSIFDAINTHFKDFQYILYTSRNHQKEKHGFTADRFRVLLPLSRPIITAAEYAATWRSLHKLWPFIDEKAKDPARFFFPGPLHSVKSVGRFVETVSCLSQLTANFLTKGAPQGTWNATLFRAAKDMQEQLYTMEQAIELLERPTKLPGNEGALSYADMRTIESAFSQPPRFPPRTSPTLFHTDEEGKTNIDFNQLVHDIIDPYFVQEVSHDMTITYSVHDAELRELLACPNPDVLTRHVTKEVETLFKAGSLPADLRKHLRAKDLIGYWRTHCAALTERPAPFGWPAEEGFVIKRIAFTPEAGPCPAWDSFTGRLSDPGAFMAFVWSCFEMRSRSRQALWLHGPRGQDGKSTILRVLSAYFGNAAGAINNSQISSDSRFVLSNFYNKRLAVYPDAKNTRFPMSELFRSLTSGDVVPIEFKGEGVVNAVLYVKLLIASNEEPDITLGNADMSRLMRIQVDQGPVTDDPTWESQLHEQMPQFLYACKAAYETLCPNHGQIQVNEMTRTLNEISAEDLAMPFYQLLDKYFVIDTKGRIPCREFFETLMKDQYRTTADIKNFKRFLLDTYGVRRIQSTDGKRYYAGIALKKGLVRIPSIVS
jgi:hypothetical protein